MLFSGYNLPALTLGGQSRAVKTEFSPMFILKEKTSKLPLEPFYQVLITSFKNRL